MSALCFASVVAAALAQTPLDDYVAAPKPAFGWTLEETTPGVNYTRYDLRVTSQVWRDATEVDQTLWQHWAAVAVPDEVSYDKAILIIEGGDNDQNRPASIDEIELLLPLFLPQLGVPIVYLQQVPNQPLRFSDESFDRSEDEIIAYTIDKFFETNDAEWPLLLPMVQSALATMDAAEALVWQEEGQGVETWIVGGASKRGWTTWLTAAAAPQRVEAIFPVVIDVLNMEESLRHHLGAYGEFSGAVSDYNDLLIFDRIATDQGIAVREFIDPYSFLDRLTMPKFIFTAAGDEFFPADSAQFYFDDLAGDKYLRTFPNFGHGLGFDEIAIIFPLLNLLIDVANEQPVPDYSWEVLPFSRLRAETTGAVTSARLWEATNPNTRDFRDNLFGDIWSSTPLSIAKQGDTAVFDVTVPPPPQGWTGYFIEMQFEDGYSFTTELVVTPDFLPFDDTDGDGLIDRDDPDADADGLAGADDPSPWDTDNDGLGNERDDDDDGDGIDDKQDPSPLDTDNDGLANDVDADDDNDGIADGLDAFPLDTDNDGVANDVDLDDDGDGLDDATDDPFLFDTDNDGVPNVVDADDDNDGIDDGLDAFPLDTDNDGLGNDLDLDDDGDGIDDSDEILQGSDPLDSEDPAVPAGSVAIAVLLVGGAAVAGVGRRRR